MQLGEFRNNQRGMTPTISAILLVAITMAAMLLVINSGQDIIQTQSIQMGERLCVENVFFSVDQIKMYVSNVGDGDITLEYAVVNGKIHNLTDGFLTLPELDGQFVNIDNYEVNLQGHYKFSFISSRNKNLGLTEVEYP
jgi:hypothetical protein